ncbi:MAG TPA: S8 family serine peptidase, partial [Symbiobacteriaceae bacterium]|nr:S8 family serine peptidase [Symbiobacteriaceae bacterium]
TCTFSTKINNAHAAGAIAVVIYQNAPVAPISMSTDGVSIPAVMIGLEHGQQLVDWDGDRTITLHTPSEKPSDSRLLADFSSWGPTPNYTLKPDVAAPGANIYSSVVGGGFASYSGTSMATPHVAGASALLLAYSRENGLGWGPAEVKAALMGTAMPGPDTDDPLKVGAGMIDLSRAMTPAAMAFPSSLSFELVRPVGNHTYVLTMTLTNTTGDEQTYTLADSNGGIVSVNPGTLTLAAGESGMVSVTVEDRGEPAPGQEGYPELRRGVIMVSSGAGDIRVPYLYVMDYNR